MDTTALTLLSATTISTLGWTVTASVAARLAHRLRHDPLTGLPNREALAALVRRATRSPSRRGRAVGLLMLDIDRFKTINDAHGHAVGDTVLQVVAGRLAALAGPGEVAIRLHGDEFALWLGHHRSSEAARTYALLRAFNVRAALAQPVEAGRHRLAATASVGAAALPATRLSVAALLAKADHAMYQAKRINCHVSRRHADTARPYGWGGHCRVDLGITPERHRRSSLLNVREVEKEH